jgi:putative phosphoribosyl transferase
MLFKDRKDAGQQLAKELTKYARSDALVLALPRGGVPVAFEVALALNAPLDVFLVRKLGVPGHEELAMGAIASGGIRVLNPEVVTSLHISEAAIEQVAAQEQQELERRQRLYRDNLPAPNVRDHRRCAYGDRTVILIDDGLATGATMRVAVKALQQQQLAHLVVGVPVSSPETCQEFESEVDEIICAKTPRPFYSVGLWYDNFSQTTDEEVRELLDRAARNAQRSAVGAG